MASATVSESAEHKAYYDTDYHRTYRSVLLEPEVYDCWVEMIDWYYFDASDRRARLFEYGCGFGQAIAHRDHRQHRAGWDISAEARDIAREHGAQVFDTMESVEKGVWERVFCRHVLEHVEHPLLSLHAMAELLTPDGELILVLPREEHVRVPLAPDWSQHLYCWNFLTINNLLLRAGLQPVSNEIKYPVGWTRLARVRRRIPTRAFQMLVKAGGGLHLHGELIIRAKRFPISAPV